jgi:histidinol phosphatase-like PHP family hydrolase/predicted nuclease with RNAse H fold/dephospho-CoA kinase
VRKSGSKDLSMAPGEGSGLSQHCRSLPPDYFRIRDFEYAQPLYDLAFLLEVDALAKGAEVPKYRTFSLWRAGYSLDGYGTTIDRWLDGTTEGHLDYAPSSRIREYLAGIRKTGTIPELRSYRGERFERCLRLRSVRGLGPAKIALTVSTGSLDDGWFSQAAINLALDRERIAELYERGNHGPWQSAHIVPPLLRLLHSVESIQGDPLRWCINGFGSAFEPVTATPTIFSSEPWESIKPAIEKALRREKQFHRNSTSDSEGISVSHSLGWQLRFSQEPARGDAQCISELAHSLDPIASGPSGRLLSDLHLHTAWSDGSASVNTMAEAIMSSGLRYFAVTDHSRSSKLQGGLTPPLWLRQAHALSLARPHCPVLHGIEVDILRSGELDLPHSLLAAADWVVASVHSSWTSDARLNTDRVLKAVESGCIDVLAHPTSALVGKPGVPDYVRPPAQVNWDEVFEACARYQVAVEFNCFPSRLDLPVRLLKTAIQAGCAISVGSDAHARSHLLNLRFGDAMLGEVRAPLVLNSLPHPELTKYIANARKARRGLSARTSVLIQGQLPFLPDSGRSSALVAKIEPPQAIPTGSTVVGIDLTAGAKATGLAFLNGAEVQTCSLITDEEILDFVRKKEPRIVSIDSPLGLPGGGDSINPEAGIVRVAEHDLASVGIPAYPALIDSMRELTLRGIKLSRAIGAMPFAPRVIESYPGAAQDILCIPRKQKSLDLLREGLRRLGLTGRGLDTKSDDEMDAITAAIVGRYFEADLFEPMGIRQEAQLIVPKIRPLSFEAPPIICLAGKTGAGKSVVARYLSVFYGFEWIRTRDVIRALLIEDLAKPIGQRSFHRVFAPNDISEMDIREFGAFVLNVCNQAPLRSRLTTLLSRLDRPVVVDSVRDTTDIDTAALSERPIATWFIDCSDSLIQRRLATRRKGLEKTIKTSSPVDRTAETIRKLADHEISNNGTLEDLRFRTDDAVFAAIRTLAP